MTTESLHPKDGVLAGTINATVATHPVDGYLARPEGQQSYPAVVLIQEYWGIEPHIQQLTERFAREGYVVLAPDLYHGKVAQEPDEAVKMVMALNWAQASDEVSRAIDYLLAREDVSPKKIGVVGFCMGGLLTWKAAEREDGRLAVIAPFYAGRYDPSAEDMRKVTAPALVVWGGDDASISAENRDKVTALLEQEGKTHKALTYPGAGHAFLNDKHDGYNAEAATQAYAELVAWFAQYLQ